MAKRKIPSLIIERAEDEGNLRVLSVIEYRKENFLVVVDNITQTEIGAYVLDYAQQENLNTKLLLEIITNWYHQSSASYPLSFEFSRLGISEATNRIFKTFELIHVTRFIGKDFSYGFDDAVKVKRRRANKIPAGIEVRLKRSQAINRTSPVAD